MLAYKACPESRNCVIGFPTYWCAGIDGTSQLISSWYRNSIIQFRYVFLATCSLYKLRYDLLPRVLIIDWFVGKGVPLFNDVPTMLNLDTIWRRVVSFMSRPLCTLGKSLMYLLHRRVDGLQNQSGYGSEEKISAPAGNQTPILWTSGQWLIWGYLIRFFQLQQLHSVICRMTVNDKLERTRKEAAVISLIALSQLN
jgi:hypothetical protein